MEILDAHPHTTAGRKPLYTQREIRAGWVLHVFTASGVIVGMLALQSTVEGHARAAILWLVAAMLMDGIDGPIARKINVRHAIPHIDGNTLDLIVDYFTCTIVPVPFLGKFNMRPTARSRSPASPSSSPARCGWHAPTWR